MVNRLVLVAAGVVMMSTRPATAHPETADRRIIIRIYNTSGVLRPRLETARRTADAILRDAGVEAAWRVCRTYRGPSAKASDACAELLMPNEVIVRIVAAPPKWPRFSFGFSYVDPQVQRGSLSTAFGDRIRRAAIRVRVDEGRLLGRVIAHEVGHLLLGTVDHSADGLMRAQWADLLLHRDLQQDWLFSELEAAGMRRAVTARTLEAGGSDPDVRAGPARPLVGVYLRR